MSFSQNMSEIWLKCCCKNTRNSGPAGGPSRRGNPAGRPRGSRNRKTLAARELLDGESGALTAKAIEMAMSGDASTMRLCLERLVAPRRDPEVRSTCRRSAMPATSRAPWPRSCGHSRAATSPPRKPAKSAGSSRPSCARSNAPISSAACARSRRTHTRASEDNAETQPLSALEGGRGRGPLRSNGRVRWVSTSALESPTSPLPSPPPNGPWRAEREPTRALAIKGIGRLRPLYFSCRKQLKTAGRRRAFRLCAQQRIWPGACRDSPFC